MNELTAICRVATVDGFSFTQLRDCMSYGQAFGLNGTEWIVLAVAALLGMRVAVFGRKQPSSAAEGLVCVPLAAYGGMVGGLLFAQWLPPWLLGTWLLFVAVAALGLLIFALVKGNASAGWKVLGSIELVVIAAAVATVAIFCFAIPENNAAEAYQRYLDAVTWLFTGAAVIDALFVTTNGSYHWAVGWFLIPLNASWGALGNLMGVIHHTLSWNCFKTKEACSRTSASSTRSTRTDCGCVTHRASRSRRGPSCRARPWKSTSRITSCSTSSSARYSR
jgi:hypothetical protein